MFRYYNANPLGRRVNDCTVRAISLATGATWDETYEKLSHFAQSQAIMPDEVLHIDQFLGRRYQKICHGKQYISVGQFADEHREGVYLVTMNGHITCVIDGVIWDTFDPSERLVWESYKVK